MGQVTEGHDVAREMIKDNETWDLFLKMNR